MKKIWSLYFCLLSNVFASWGYDEYYSVIPVYIETPTIQTVMDCPDTSWSDNGSNCKKTEYLDIPNSVSGSYTFVNNGISGTDAYIKTPSCSGKSMSVSPYSSTPHYGNNGICYSDIGLYCKTYAGSTSVIQMPDGKQITCWDNTQTCNDTKFNLVYNYSGVSDKCNKYNYTCDNKSRYGLTEHPTFNNPTDLFNRISDKDTKILSYLTEIANKQDILLNDNFGAMCVENIESNYNPVSKDYLIDSKTKSGF
jgi:hypothetical protein